MRKYTIQEPKRRILLDKPGDPKGCPFHGKVGFSSALTVDGKFFYYQFDCGCLVACRKEEKKDRWWIVKGGISK